MRGGPLFLAIMLLLACSSKQVVTSKNNYSNTINLPNHNADLIYHSSIDWLDKSFQENYKSNLQTDDSKKTINSVVYYRFINEGFYHIQKENLTIKGEDDNLFISFSNPVITKVKGGLMEDDLIHRPQSLSYHTPNDEENMFITRNRNDLVKNLIQSINNTEFSSH